MDRRNILKNIVLAPLLWLFPSLVNAKSVEPPAKGSLHIFYTDNDFYIATSPSDAARRFCEETGCRLDCESRDVTGCCHGAAAEDWTQWPDDKPFPMFDWKDPCWDGDMRFNWDGDMRLKTVEVAYHGRPNGNYYTHRTTAMASWWIEKRGPGYFASTS